ncbi:hypothetical protein Pondi_00041 [Escherichia phage Pondi]|nr:hypothetical protein Pondi_00041 [Escherichia phage Pondi]
MIYICDLDGTLYDNRHRAHLMPTGDKRNDTEAWAQFNGACRGDKPIPNMLAIIKQLLASGEYVRFLTGRGKSAYLPTMDRLHNDLELSRTLIELQMRPMDDHRSAAEFKCDILRRLLKTYGTEKFTCFEDDPEVCAAFEALSDRVIVVQVDSLCAAVLDGDSNK